MAQRWDGPLWHTGVGHFYMERKHPGGQALRGAVTEVAQVIVPLLERFVEGRPGNPQSGYRWPYDEQFSGIWDVDRIARALWVYYTQDPFKVPQLSGVQHPTAWGLFKALATEGAGQARLFAHDFYQLGGQMTLSYRAVAAGLEAQPAFDATRVVAALYYEVALWEEKITDGGDAGGYWTKSSFRLPDGSMPAKVARGEYRGADTYQHGHRMYEHILDRITLMLNVHLEHKVLWWIIGQMDVIDTMADSPVGG